MRNREESKAKARFLPEILMAITAMIGTSRRRTYLVRGRGENQGLRIGSAKIERPIRYPRTKYEDSEEKFILEI